MSSENISQPHDEAEKAKKMAAKRRKDSHFAA
jgi:hypothetical protein